MVSLSNQRSPHRDFDKAIALRAQRERESAHFVAKNK